MLPKINRITKKKDFSLVFKKGTSCKNNFLILKTTKNGLDFSRFGFIVSQKISKKAVARNRVKRLLRETVRLRLQDIKKGFDCVFISLPGAIANGDFREIKEKAEQLLEKSGLYV